jgi:hypothetical protein
MMAVLSADSETDLAASIAPEDLRCGDYVAVLSVIYEYPSFLWCCDSVVLPRNEPVRLQFTGAGDAGLLKIKALCLPFVFVKEPVGTYRTVDIRLCRLVRLSPKYARRVWKTLRRKKRESGGM